MSDEMKFKEEELESMADKLLEQAAMSEISDQQELELPKPKKKAAKKKEADPAEAAKTNEERLNELLEKGKKKGSLTTKELEVLEEMNLDGETVDKFYETLEANGVDAVVGHEDMLDLTGRQTGVDGPHQRRRTGDDGGGSRCATK